MAEPKLGTLPISISRIIHLARAQINSSGVRDYAHVTLCGQTTGVHDKPNVIGCEQCANCANYDIEEPVPVTSYVGGRKYECLNPHCRQYGVSHWIAATKTGPFLTYQNIECVCGKVPAGVSAYRVPEDS
jgi:hypothetical protein